MSLNIAEKTLRLKTDFDEVYQTAYEKGKAEGGSIEEYDGSYSELPPAEGLAFTLIEGGWEVSGIGTYTGKNVSIPNEHEGLPVIRVGNKAFEENKNIESVTLPDSLTSIGNWAFYGCENITSVNIPRSVTSIGEHAFRDCYGLTDVTIQNGVTHIGESAFLSCVGIKSIIVPGSVTNIGGNVFFRCKKMTSAVIENGFTSISHQMFVNCENLETVYIPNSVTSISKAAFYNCGKLKTVYYIGTEEQWNKISISESNGDLIGANIVFGYTEPPIESEV